MKKTLASIGHALDGGMRSTLSMFSTETLNEEAIRAQVSTQQLFNQPDLIKIVSSPDGTIYALSPEKIFRFRKNSDWQAEEITSLGKLYINQGKFKNIYCKRDGSLVIILENESELKILWAKITSTSHRLSIESRICFEEDPIDKIALNERDDTFLIAFRSGQIIYWVPKDKTQPCKSIKLFSEVDSKDKGISTLRFLQDDEFLAASTYQKRMVKIHLTAHRLKSAFIFDDTVSEQALMHDATIVVFPKFIICQAEATEPRVEPMLLLVDRQTGQEIQDDKLLHPDICHLNPLAILPESDNSILVSLQQNKIAKFNLLTGACEWQHKPAYFVGNFPIRSLSLLAENCLLSSDGRTLHLWHVGSSEPGPWPVTHYRAGDKNSTLIRSIAKLPNGEVAFLQRNGILYLASLTLPKLILTRGAKPPTDFSQLIDVETDMDFFNLLPKFL